MSDILVNKVSSSAQTSTDSWVDVTDLVQSSVTVDSTDDVLLLIATISIDQSNSNDDCITLRFAVDDVREGPEIAMFKDETNGGCGAAICWALTGISGSHKFALQMQSRGSKHGDLDTGRVRSFQVIAITDATILVNKTSLASDTVGATWSDIAGLTDTQTVTAGSILLLLGNMMGTLDGGEWVYRQRFTVGGSFEGPDMSCFKDNSNEGCGQSMMWMKSGISGSTAFALQWENISGDATADVNRVRSLQVIEITANANLPFTPAVSQAADGLTSSYTDIAGMTGSFTVDGTGSILIIAAGVSPVADGQDECGSYRIYDGSTGEGPENYCFSDTTDESCGHSVYWAVTGKSGSHTFTTRGLNVQGVVNMETGRNRSFCILELTVAAGGATFFKVIPATAIGVGVLGSTTTFARTLPATTIGTPVVATIKTGIQALLATAIGVATVNTASSFFRTLSATAIAVPVLLKKMFVTLAATSIGTAVLVTIKSILQTLAATAIGVATLNTISTHLRTLVATATGTATLNTVSTFFRTLAATAVGSAALVKKMFVTLTATAVGVATIVAVKFFSVALAAVSTGVATLGTIATHLRTLAATAIGIATLTRINTFVRTLAATAVGSATLVKKMFVTITARSMGIATLVAVKFFNVTMAATAVGVAVLGRIVTNVQALIATAVGIVTLNTIRTAFVTLAVIAVGVPSLVKRMFVTLVVIAVVNPILEATKFFSVLLAAIATGVVTLNTRISFTKTLAATAVGVATLAQRLTLSLLLIVIAVGVAGLTAFQIFPKLAGKLTRIASRFTSSGEIT